MIVTIDEYETRPVAWQRGFSDGRHGHSPAELTVEYLEGFALGDEHRLGPKVVCRCSLCERLNERD